MERDAKGTCLTAVIPIPLFTIMGTTSCQSLISFTRRYIPGKPATRNSPSRGFDPNRSLTLAEVCFPSQQPLLNTGSRSTLVALNIILRVAMQLIKRDEPNRFIFLRDPIMASHVYKGIRDGKAHQSAYEEVYKRCHREIGLS